LPRLEAAEAPAVGDDHAFRATLLGS